jgi:hypothetical protein
MYEFGTLTWSSACFQGKSVGNSCGGLHLETTNPTISWKSALAASGRSTKLRIFHLLSCKDVREYLFFGSTNYMQASAPKAFCPISSWMFNP